MKKNLLSAKLFQFLLNGKFCFRDSYIVSDCLVLRHVVLQQFLEKERNTLQQIQKNLTDVIAKAAQNEQEVPDKTKLRMEEVEEQLSMNTAAREYYDVRVKSR